MTNKSSQRQSNQRQGKNRIWRQRTQILAAIVLAGFFVFISVISVGPLERQATLGGRVDGSQQGDARGNIASPSTENSNGFAVGPTTDGVEAVDELQEPARRPSDWHWLQRTFPHYAADPSAIRTALEKRTQLVRMSKSATDEWTFLGPENIGGRIVDIEYHPKDPEIVYFGAATGGVFKSHDGGVTWAPIFDNQVALTIGDIGIDPNHPDTIYVGTGEANGGHNNFAGGGVYKSTNGGTSWSYSGLEEVVSIGRIVVDPANSERVFVAAVGSYFLPNPERGVYRSDDGGDSWSNVLSVSDSTGVIDLVINPRNSDTLYAATWERVRRPNGTAFLHGGSSGIHRSIDGGDSWTPLGVENGLPDPLQYLDSFGRPTFGRIGLAISKSEPSNVYALFTDGFGFLGLYRSIDGGDTWVAVSTNSTFRSIFSNFSWYFGQIRVHPTDPETFYVLDVQKARTEDGGATWERPQSWHVDYHALAFSPLDGNTLLFGNDGGLEKSTDGGISSIAIRNLPITQFYEVNFDPSAPDEILGGTQDNGTVRSRFNQTDSWTQISGGDGFYVIVNPENSAIVYSSSQNGQLYRSGFTIVRPSDFKSNWSTPVAMDPSDSNVLYYGSERLLRTINGGDDWSAVSQNLTSHPVSQRLGTITTISIAPSDPNVIYVGTDDGNVWVTRDYGANWQSISTSLPQRWVTRIEAHPADPANAVVTFSGLKWRDSQPHVFQTHDYGQTWQNISGNLPDAPVNALALDPLYPDHIFVGTDVGAFFTLDAGLSWDVFGSGLPAVPVYDLKFVETERRIIAGTHGRSMYSIDAPGITTSIDSPDVESGPEPVITGTAFPNPFSTRLSITFEGAVSKNPTSAGITGSAIGIYDILGRRVRLLEPTNRTSELVNGTWDAAGDDGARVANGIYFARLHDGISNAVHGPSVSVVLVD